MAFNDLASNQGVSFTNAQTGGFTLKPGQSSVTSNEMMTKLDATTKYYLDTSNIYLSPKPNNQVVVKRDLTPGDPGTATLTITYESQYWIGLLSASIPSTSITISGGTGRGYYDACLGAPDENVNMNWIDNKGFPQNGFTIAAGNTTASLLPTTPFTVSVINYNIVNAGMVINGTARANGAVFTVGGTTVTLVMPISCTPYA
jgi:hypothetical protein